MNQAFTNTSFQPCWWEGAPRPRTDDALPSSADVVIAGTGYTGINAALTLSRAGRKVVGLDSAEIGFGASTRNGGQIGPGNQKFTVRQLIDRFGEERAKRIYREGDEMLAYFRQLVGEEGIDCDLDQCGRFRGAITSRHFDTMARGFEAAQRFAGVKGHVVTKEDVKTEILSDKYVGGVVLSEDGSVDPGRFHAGLLERARAAGAVFLAHTPVTGYRSEKSGITVATPAGTIHARDLVFATNGYTGTATGLLHNKIVPVASGIIATEPLDRQFVDGLMPGRRVYGETRRVFHYFRASPDRTRVLFGGYCREAHSSHPSDYAGLYASMRNIFPALKDIGISHAWSGYVGVTRDNFPHIGSQGAVHHAMGYCGTGITRATYFGNKIALRLLGDERGHTEFDDMAFPDHRWPARYRFAVNTYVRWMHLRDIMDQTRAGTR